MSEQPLTYVMLSTTDWDAPQFGSRQQVARELTRRGRRVLFVEVPRALHSLISDPAGTRRALGRLGRTRQPADGPLVYTPWPVLPVYYHPWVAALNARLLLADLRRVQARLGWRPDVLWTYWPHTGDLIGRLGERVSVYHCIDDFAAAGYPLTPRGAIARLEAAQCARVDLIFARSQVLAEAKRRLNPNTVFLPGGVDTVAFDPQRVGMPPAEVAALPRPRVGLVGTLDDRIDAELLAAAARALPAVTFVLVGPLRRHRADLGALAELPNVRFLPPCAHEQVPAITAALDVCLIPYRINAYTEALSPIKLHECLALGKPVVATDLPYVRLEAAHVRIARGAEEFAAAIRQALDRPPSEEEREGMRGAALARSWGAQVGEMERAVARVLGGGAAVNRRR